MESKCGIEPYLSRDVASDGVGGTLDSCTVSRVGTVLFDDLRTGAFPKDDGCGSVELFVMSDSESPPGDACRTTISGALPFSGFRI
jgi:hypothetical protein